MPGTPSISDGRVNYSSDILYQNFIVDFISNSYGHILQVLFSDVLHWPKRRYTAAASISLASPLQNEPKQNWALDGLGDVKKNYRSFKLLRALGP